MQEYVLIYCKTLNDIVPVVLKEKPDFLKGLLNLPGGKVEEGETPVEAAKRELKEELGLEGEESDFVYCGTIRGNDCNIYCIKYFTQYITLINPRKEEVETFLLENYEDLFTKSNLAPNLRLILPLMKNNYSGWIIKDIENWNFENYNVTLFFDIKSNPVTVNLRGLLANVK